MKNWLITFIKVFLSIFTVICLLGNTSISVVCLGSGEYFLGSILLFISISVCALFITITEKGFPFKFVIKENT